MITIYTLTYNEEFMLPFFIEHYRALFPGCNIVVYDNESTDRTRQIAKDNGCEVRLNQTMGQLSDARYLAIKNNCWKTADTDWVLVADCDELCCITEKQLMEEATMETTLISFDGYNMVNMHDDMDLHGINHGVRAKSYDKTYCFNKQHIQEINYHMGCHTSSPVGNLIKSLGTYFCFHYKYINADYMVKRHAQFAARLSEENKAKGYGGHYQYPEGQIREEFNNARKQAIKIL